MKCRKHWCKAVKLALIILSTAYRNVGSITACICTYLKHMPTASDPIMYLLPIKRSLVSLAETISITIPRLNMPNRCQARRLDIHYLHMNRRRGLGLQRDVSLRLACSAKESRRDSARVEFVHGFKRYALRRSTWELMLLCTYRATNLGLRIQIPSADRCDKACSKEDEANLAPEVACVRVDLPDGEVSRISNSVWKAGTDHIRDCELHNKPPSRIGDCNQTLGRAP